MALTKVTKDMVASLDASIIDSSGASDNDVLTYTTGGGVVWSAPAGGSSMGQYSAAVNTTSATGSYTFSSIPFVVGQVFVEYLDNSAANQNTAVVVAAGWVNLRSYNGTKTDNTSNRYSQMIYVTSGSQSAHFIADRTSTGTSVTIGRIQLAGLQSTGFVDTGVGLFSWTPESWDTGFSLRITAYEDMQS